MAVSDADPKKLAEISRKAQKALDADDPAAQQAVVRELADQVGTDGLMEIWKSGS